MESSTKLARPAIVAIERLAAVPQVRRQVDGAAQRSRHSVVGKHRMATALQFFCRAMIASSPNHSSPNPHRDSSTPPAGRARRRDRRRVSDSLLGRGRLPLQRRDRAANDMYDTLVNLQTGPRILDQTLSMQSVDHQGLLFDNLYLNSLGWGGDPNNYLRLRADKDKWYNLQSSFRRDQNFFDYDLLANPLNPPTSTPSIPVLNSPHAFRYDAAHERRRPHAASAVASELPFGIFA